jgi:DNA topoisomerase III
MGKVLVLAEKPSVARDIAKVLGCTKKGNGCLVGAEYIVTWAVGHLITLLEPEEYDIKYKKWRYDTLPIIPDKMKLKPIGQTKDQFETVRKLIISDEVESLICATDSGREGELIFRYIYEMAQCNKSFKRLWISSMTDAAITDGFKKLKAGEEYDSLYYSARCRSEADWLVGMNASRAFTIRYNTLLSVGRVQTPTLAILVERQKEINAFVAQEYFEITADFGVFKGTWFNKENKDTKIPDKKKAEEIFEKILGKAGKIADVEKEDKKQPPPLLYDLTELQREANKKLGFTAQKTLGVAQDLYEKRKLITYPRTDSRYLSEDMVPKLKHILSKINIDRYKQNIEFVLKLSELPVNKRIVDDSKVTDHHAIIPTEVRPDLGKLTVDEAKIYDLIARRFISVFYPNYLYTLTRITSEVQEELFATKGKTVNQLGWMELYKNDEKNDKEKDEEEQELPPVNIGDEIKVQDATLQKKKTKAPSPYTEASLLSAMENAGRFVEDEELKEQLKEGGLGTPATRAAIIERLIHVGYITRKGKGLIPTEKGMKLIEIVPMELKSPETTGKWEKGLSSISKGKLTSERFMESITRYVKYIVQKSKEANSNIMFEEVNKSKPKYSPEASIAQCPLCGTGHILEHSKGFYCTNWRQGCKFTMWKDKYEREGKVLNAAAVKEIISRKEKVNN